MSLPWDVRFVQELEYRITEDIEQTYANFGQGGWINRADAAATGMQAVMIQCRIDGLRIALKHIKQTHDAMTGKVKDKEKAA